MARPAQVTRLTGVDRTHRHWLAELREQHAESLFAIDRGVALRRTRLIAHREIFQILSSGAGAEHKFHRAEPKRRDPSAARRAQATSIFPRGLRRWRALARTSAARNCSVSPARALRRPMRIFWPSGAVRSRPTLSRQPDHRIGVGLKQPACAAIERHVRKSWYRCNSVRRSVLPPPPRSPCDLPPDPSRRRDAGRACADHDDSASRGKRCGRRAPPEKPCLAARRADADRKVAAGHCHVMVSRLKEARTWRTVPHLT